MRVIERLRNYIQEEISAGRLHPGDRLPSLRSLTEILGGSYVTMHSAMEKLQKEQIVTVNNTGTYLSGTNTIPIRINIPGSDLSPEAMAQLLKKHLVNAELYLDFEIHETGEIKTLEELRKIQKTYAASISVASSFHSPDDHLLPANLKEFSDYTEHLDTLEVHNGTNQQTSLPFSSCGIAMGINRKLMDKIGFDWHKITSDFIWWDEYAEKCRNAGIPPSRLHWNRLHLFFFNLFDILCMAVCGSNPEEYHDMTAVFETETGRRFLKILNDVDWVESSLPALTAFFRNETPFVFQVGSWIAIQNNNPDYADVTVDSLEILPYRNANGESLFLSNPNILEIWFRDSLVAEERKRIWQLAKIMTSRDFQLDYCGKTGIISSVKDIYPTEYYWNRSGKWNAFFSGERDRKIFRNQLFNRNINGIISTILEHHIFDGLDTQTTLRLLDRKKAFPKLNK